MSHITSLQNGTFFIKELSYKYFYLQIVDGIVLNDTLEHFFLW